MMVQINYLITLEHRRVKELTKDFLDAFLINGVGGT